MRAKRFELLPPKRLVSKTRAYTIPPSTHVMKTRPVELPARYRVRLTPNWGPSYVMEVTIGFEPMYSGFAIRTLSSRASYHVKIRPYKWG